MSARTTIYDVARQAGVSISTVSRVVNDSPDVSTETRSRVLATVERLRFLPQRTAKTLARREPTAIAVALPSATSLFYVEILKGVKDVLRAQDVDLLLCNLGSTAPASVLARFLDRGALDALLVASIPVGDALAARLAGMQAPIVLVGSEHATFDSLSWDDRAGARSATEHLIALGHRRIGLIAAHAWSHNAEGRLQGYRDALQNAGLPFDPSLVETGLTTKHAGYSEEAGAEALAKLLDDSDPPTAVFASSDVQAYGAWAAARERGLVVPRDLSIVGYDDLKLSRFLGLTTVEQQMQEIGRRATERLIARLSALVPLGVAALQERIVPRLVVRASTAPPRPERSRALVSSLRPL